VSRPAGPVRRWVDSWVGSSMSFAGLNRLDLNKPLPVGIFQLTDNLPDRRHDRSHGKRQPVDFAPCVLVIANGASVSRE
jgi:hypothetical protein